MPSMWMLIKSRSSIDDGTTYEHLTSDMLNETLFVDSYELELNEDTMDIELVEENLEVEINDTPIDIEIIDETIEVDYAD